MKKLAFTSILTFLILVPCVNYAANTSIVANYPAPNGSYNKVVLQGLYVSPACGTIVGGAYVNAGMLYMYTDLNSRQSLAMCTNDGTAIPVYYPQTCFNRFWNSPQNISTPNGCPTGYVLGSTSDSLKTDNAPTTVNVTVCCTTNYGSTTLGF